MQKGYLYYFYPAIYDYESRALYVAMKQLLVI